MPISPRSPVSSDGRSANGVGSSCPFLTILIFPLRSRMKIRPSGAISKPDGPSRPSPTTSEVWKSAGAAATARRGGHQPERQQHEEGEEARRPPPASGMESGRSGALSPDRGHAKTADA